MIRLDLLIDHFGTEQGHAYKMQVIKHSNCEVLLLLIYSLKDWHRYTLILLLTTMDGRKAAVCLIIVLVLALGNPTSAGVCWQSNTKMPFCAGFMCKISCWISSKFTKQNVKSYRCRGSGPKGRCYCNICDKNY